VEAMARASNLEGTRFNGFGNDAPDLDDDLSLVWQRRVEADLRWVFPLGGERAWLSVGPSAAYVDYDVPAGGPAAALTSGFTDAASQFGAAVEIEVDGRDDRVFPRRGFRLDAGTAAYGQSGGRGGAFGRVDGRASAYLSVGRGPVLALRAGAERALGDYPLHEAAFLGGSREVRGLPHQRYAGDAAAYGGAELRLPLLPAELFIRGTLGVSGFADAGRVWMDGDSDGGWHASQGAGVWFATPLAAVGAYYAFTDEGNRLQFRLGMPF
jgi:outer membrane protein assembly factor BamA